MAKILPILLVLAVAASAARAMNLPISQEEIDLHFEIQDALKRFGKAALQAPVSRQSPEIVDYQGPAFAVP